MAKKTTMKRKMKKRGTRRCWGGGPDSKRTRIPSEKGHAYKASIATKKTGSKIKQESKIVSKQVNDELSDLFSSSMSISSSKTSPK